MIALFNYYFLEDVEILKACTKIPGIGKKMGQQALDRAGITGHIAIGKVTALQLSKIKEIIEQSYVIENELRALTKQNINRLSAISSYRGFKHYQGLPCRGQRTHSNARTCRKLKRK